MHKEHNILSYDSISVWLSRCSLDPIIAKEYILSMSQTHFSKDGISVWNTQMSKLGEYQHIPRSEVLAC